VCSAESEEVPGALRQASNGGKRPRSKRSRKEEQKQRALAMLREQQAETQSQFYVDSAMAGGDSPGGGAGADANGERPRASASDEARGGHEAGSSQRDGGGRSDGGAQVCRDSSQISASQNAELDKQQREAAARSVLEASLRRSEDAMGRLEDEREGDSTPMSTPETSEDLDDYDPTGSQHASNQSFMVTPTSHKRGPFAEGPISGGPLSDVSQGPLSAPRRAGKGSSAADPASMGPSNSGGPLRSEPPPSSAHTPLAPLSLTQGEFPQAPEPAEPQQEAARDRGEAGIAATAPAEANPAGAADRDPEPPRTDAPPTEQTTPSEQVAGDRTAGALEGSGAKETAEKAPVVEDEGPASFAVDDGSFAAIAAELAAKRAAVAAGTPSPEPAGRSEDCDSSGAGTKQHGGGRRAPSRWQSLMQPTAASQRRMEQVAASRARGPQITVSGGKFELSGERMRARLGTPHRQPARPTSRPATTGQAPPCAAPQRRPGMMAKRSQSTPVTSSAIVRRKPMLPREVTSRLGRSPTPLNRRSTPEPVQSVSGPRKAPLDTGLPRHRAMALRSSHDPPPQQPQQRRRSTTAAPPRRKTLAERPAFGLSPSAHAAAAPENRRSALSWDRPWRAGMKQPPSSAPGERSRAQSRLMAPTASSRARVAAAGSGAASAAAAPPQRKPLLPREARQPPRRSRPASPPRVRPPAVTTTRRSTRPEVESWLSLDVHHRRQAPRGPGWISQATLKRRQRLQEMGRIPSPIESPHAVAPISPAVGYVAAPQLSPSPTLPSASPPTREQGADTTERASLACVPVLTSCIYPLTSQGFATMSFAC
jgi:hypothetical protein